jgi:hypothetical protein
MLHKGTVKIVIKYAGQISGFGSSFTMDTLAGTFASPACLPDVLHTTNEVGIVSGWGTIREGKNFFSIMYSC